MSTKCSATRLAKRSIVCVMLVASLLAGALPASAAPGPPIGPANPPTPANLVLWNRFETEQDVLTSEVGPDVQLVNYIYQNWEEAMIAPAQFGNGLFVNHDTGEGWRNDGANFFAADISQTTLSPERGTIEFWFKFRYDSSTFNHAYFFQSGASLAGHLPGYWSDTCPYNEDMGLSAGWNGWDYGSYGKRFFFDLNWPGAEPGQRVSASAWTPDFSAAPGGAYDFSDGTLMHFGFVWDASGIDGGPDTLRIYVNGSIAATSTETWPTEPAFDPYLYVGSMSNCDPWDTFYNAVKGVTDNLVIWNYAKTDFSDRFDENPLPSITGTVTQTASTTPAVHGTYVDVAASLTNSTGADISNAFALVPIDPDTEFVTGSASGGAFPLNARAAAQLIQERGLQGAEALSGLDLSGKSPEDVVAMGWAGPIAAGETVNFAFAVKVIAMNGEVQHDIAVFDGATYLASIIGDPLTIVDNSTYTHNRSRRFNVDRDTFIEGSDPGAFNGDAQTMWVGFFNQMRPVLHTPLSGIPTDSAVDTAYLYVYVFEGRGFANWATSVIPNVQASPVTIVWMPDATNWFTPWIAPGGDFGPSGPSTNLGSGKIGTWLRLDVTAAAEDMLRSGFNQGFMLTSDDVNGVRYGLATKENWTGYIGYMRIYFRTAE